MKVVLQRVSRGSVSVGGVLIAEITQGLVVLLGVGPDDTREVAQTLAKKIAQLRIFPDDQGKMNLSLLDVGGSALVVPQFTLFADTSRGHRPSFIKAAPPEIARPLAAYFASYLQDLGVPTEQGEFGAHMRVEILNDGPVTITIEV
jgi:D-tyrosyl-tRNA(Tyr) deacylase